jgi:hypothetical protein
MRIDFPWEYADIAAQIEAPLACLRMSEAWLIVAGIEVCPLAGSATVVGLNFGSGGHITVPSSVFFS